MSLRSTVFLFFFISILAIIPRSFGQNSVEDSIALSKPGQKAKADEIFFDAMKALMHDDDKQARELLEQFIAMKPDVSAAYYELSKIDYSNRKTNKAQEEIKKALQLDPTNKWYKQQYSALLAEGGSYLEAANIAAELATAEPRDKSYPIVAAEYYTKAKKYDEALKWLDKALLTDPADEDILAQKVQIYLAMNEVEKAAGVVQKLINDDPRNGKYYKWLADLYDNNKMPQEAAEVYEQAQKLIPDDAHIQAGIAEHYLNIGDTAKYISAIRKAIVNKDNEVDAQIEMLGKYMQVLPNDSAMGAQGMPILRQLVAQHPNDPQVLLLYGEFLENNNQHDSAAAAYKRSLAIKSSDFEGWERLLRCYSGRNDADSLIKYSNKAMRLFPNLAIVSYYNAIGHMNKREYPAAITAIKRAIDMQPETPDNNRLVLGDMYSLLGEIYHTNKQDDLSDKAYDKALHYDPGNVTVLNNYAYFLSERGARLDDAEKMSEASLKLRPDEATFLDTYGWIQYKKGNYLKAKDYVERAIKLMGDKADGTLYDHLGNICYQLNDKTNAVEYWKKAKEKGGDNPLIDKKISEGKLYE